MNKASDYMHRIAIISHIEGSRLFAFTCILLYSLVGEYAHT